MQKKQNCLPRLFLTMLAKSSEDKSLQSLSLSRNKLWYCGICLENPHSLMQYSYVLKYMKLLQKRKYNVKNFEAIVRLVRSLYCDSSECPGKGMTWSNVAKTSKFVVAAGIKKKNPPLVKNQIERQNQQQLSLIVKFHKNLRKREDVPPLHLSQLPKCPNKLDLAVF